MKPLILAKDVPVVPDYIENAKIICTESGVVGMLGLWGGEWWIFENNRNYKCWTSVGRATPEHIGIDQ